MKISGGTFGVSGSAFLSADGYLVVEGAKTSYYLPGGVSALDTEVVSERRWSLFNLVGGILLFVAPLTFFFGLVGLLVSGAITLLFSRYTSKENLVSLVFDDGEKVSLVCTPRQVKKLVEFKG